MKTVTELAREAGLYEQGVWEQEPDYWQQAYKMAQSLSDHLSVRPFSDPTPVNQQLLEKLPGGKHTGEWESARVADYNQGWNDYRKAVRAAIAAVENKT